MKKLLPVLVVLFFAVPPVAAFPPVPEGAASLTVFSKFEGGSVSFSLWAQNEEFYIHITPLDSYFVLSSSAWDFSQGGTDYSHAVFEASDGTTFDNETLYSAQTFRVPQPEASEDWVDYSIPFTATYLDTYSEDITPLAPSTLIPDSGIWKSDDGLLSMYVQKYDTGSVVIVVTMGDTAYTAFLDTDYEDGISAKDDVDGRGYRLSLALDGTNSGTLTATLHGQGEVSVPVSLSFGGV